MKPWRRLFLGKGVYNLTAPIAILLLMPPTGDPLYFQLFLALAWVFGIGYCRAAADPQRHRIAIEMGVLGQAAVLLLALVHVPSRTLGWVAWVQLGGGLVDGVCAALFAAFLLLFPRET